MGYRSSGQDTFVADLARGLGWFSIAIGTAELLAPRRVSRSIGMRRAAPVFRAYGLREIASGVGILTSKDPRGWLWGRVAGDVLDLLTAAPALGNRGRRGRNAVAFLGLVAAATAADVFCASCHRGQARPRMPVRDYSGRSGFPHPPEKMRGLALTE